MRHIYNKRHVPRIDLIDLELFQIVAQELSFSAAAARLTISGPAVSKRITKLEELIGEKLIHRPGPKRLTKAGERLLKLANQVTGEFLQFENDLITIQSGEPIIRIMANASLMIDDMPQVLDQLKLERPQTHVELIEGSFNQITRAVLAGDCDAGLLIGLQQVDGLQFLPYKNDRICVLAPLPHAVGQLTSIHFSDAIKHPLIGATKDKQISQFLDAIARKDNLKLKYNMRVSNFEAQAHMVALTGIGIAVMLESVARRFERIYPVRAVRLQDDWAQGQFAIVVPDAGSMSAALRDFVRLMTLRHKPAPSKTK